MDINDTLSDADLYSIEWSDIENAEMDYENYLNDIEDFFREDFKDEDEESILIADPNMKKLKELTSEIRNKLPRLMELSEGQRLLTLISDEPNDIYEGAYETIGIGAELLNNGNIEIGGYEYEIGKAFEIVGKEPMLNDVLEWLNDDSISIYSDGCFCHSEMGLYYLENGNDIIRWDLSKSYLKDQSPELIKFMHGFIKNEADHT